MKAVSFPGDQTQLTGIPILSVLELFCDVDDRQPIHTLGRELFGKFFGDKGYISQIEHSRHRSPINFLVNLLAGLIASYHHPKNHH